MPRKNTEVTFISKCSNLRLVKVPRTATTFGPGGVVLNEGQAGEDVQFKDGRFVVSVDAKFKPEDDQTVVEWLRAHKLFNELNQNNGFFEEGNAPDEPKPTLREQLAAIAQAAARQDREALKTLIAAERDTHNRIPVVEAAEEALEALSFEPEKADGDKEKAPSQRTSDSSKSE